MSTDQLLGLSVGVLVETLWICGLRFTRLAGWLGDVPNARSSHQKVIPRGAGFGFALTVFAMACFFRQFILIASMGLLIALLGLYDDMHGLRARTRFLIQAALCLITLLPTALPAGFPFLVSAFVLVLMLSAINFYNFADGINGHIALQALINLGSWLLLAIRQGFSLALLGDPILAGLAGSLLIFTWFNFYKRWVFMGDAGSTFLGFYLITMPLEHFSGSDWALYLLAALGFSFVILADCTLLLLAKLSSGIPLSMAHRHHFYQRLSRRDGWGHERTSLLLAVWQLAISLAVVATVTVHRQWIWSLALLILAYIVCAARSSFFARQELLVLRAERH